MLVIQKFSLSEATLHSKCNDVSCGKASNGFVKWKDFIIYCSDALEMTATKLNRLHSVHLLSFHKDTQLELSLKVIYWSLWQYDAINKFQIQIQCRILNSNSH